MTTAEKWRLPLLLLTLAAALLGLALANVPRADAYQASGQRPAANVLVDQAVVVGERFWHARGVQPCATPTVLLADSLADTDTTGLVYERAEMPGCTIWLSTMIVTIANARQRLGLLAFCHVVAHALGHTAGLGHTATGVMAASIDVASDRDAPYECAMWARETARPSAHASRRAR